MGGELRRQWTDLSDDEQERVKRLLTPDPDDNLDDLLARMNRAAQIIQGDHGTTSPTDGPT
jgi:hypothetical protein